MKRTLNRGFTLIELLVVIAIIGILASVVLASLNSARTKGAEAAYQAEVQQIVPSALLYCEDNPAGSYSHSEGSQTAAETVPCSDFMTGSSTVIQSTTGSNVGVCGSVSINGATYDNTGGCPAP